MSKALKGALTVKRDKLVAELKKGPMDFASVSFVWYGEVRKTSLNAVYQQLGKLKSFGYVEKLEGMYQLTELGRDWSNTSVITLEWLKQMKQEANQ